uniref:Large ribosomal subunit protein uL4m n=1 Tax=Cacopsylla melanoneura TaxID=428564 RepID=A0A8D9A1S4_9HEMI
MNFTFMKLSVFHGFNNLRLGNKCLPHQSIAFYSTQLPEQVVSNKSDVVFHETKQFRNVFHQPRQAWVENLDTAEEKHHGLVNLHPDIFGQIPRLDVINSNIEWQKKYRWVRYDHTKVTNEVERTGRKPWPQKGTGRARHGSKRGPLWLGGSRAHGPRSPTTHFFMLPFYERIMGLTSTLSIKLMQDDLHIVKDLILPVEDPKYLEQLVEERCWGPSVLFVDSTDYMERNISIVTDQIKHYNLMPVYGLNVHSMLKHDTLVLTVDALKQIEEKILLALNRSDNERFVKRFVIDTV